MEMPTQSGEIEKSLNKMDENDKAGIERDNKKAQIKKEVWSEYFTEKVRRNRNKSPIINVMPLSCLTGNPYALTHYDDIFKGIKS